MKVLYNLATVLDSFGKLTMYDRETWQDDDYKDRYRKIFVDYYEKYYEESTRDSIAHQQITVEDVSSIVRISSFKISRKSSNRRNEAMQYLNERKLLF